MRVHDHLPINLSQRNRLIGRAKYRSPRFLRCDGLRQGARGAECPYIQRPALSQSMIAPEIIQAFRETEYRVHCVPPFALRVGILSTELASTHKRYRVDCSAYITAVNPLSKKLDDACNAERHTALRKELKRSSLNFIEGVGRHPSNQWPGEASYLVFGLTLEAAKSLGARLEQNGIVWAGADAVPQLILLR